MNPVSRAEHLLIRIFFLDYLKRKQPLLQKIILVLLLLNSLQNQIIIFFLQMTEH